MLFAPAVLRPSHETPITFCAFYIELPRICTNFFRDKPRNHKFYALMATSHNILWLNRKSIKSIVEKRLTLPRGLYIIQIVRPYASAADRRRPSSEACLLPKYWWGWWSANGIRMASRREKTDTMDDTQSYLTFYGLREQPFAPTADPVYFYATREHKECLFRLWNSIDERHGIAVVLGNYGTGKTTLLRKLLTGMAADRERYNAAVVGSPIPSWTSFALLEAVVGQFGLQPDKPSFAAYMESLNHYLLESHERVNTLIIDDAQNLNKRGQLELLRLVQNLETQQHKLLNLVLFAQLEWIQVLQAAPNFEQRINMTYTLSEIGIEETRQFIDFRLRQAGAAGPLAPLFDDGAVRVIHAYANGNPRVMVTLCRNALLLGAKTGRRHINAEVVLHTVQKTTVPDAERRARAVAAARDATTLSAPYLAGDAAPVQTTVLPPLTGSRDRRAAEMLLRAVRGKQPNEDRE